MSFDRILARLRVPLIQAPMAGGITPPALVAAVSHAGALGAFGFAMTTAARIVEELAAARALTDAPVCANLFVLPPLHAPDDAAWQRARAALQPIADERGAGALAPPRPPFGPDLQAQLEAVWEGRPEVLTFHFNPPPPGTIERAHALGIVVGVSATSADEAQAIERAGADFVIAQGIEAGGHRGIFDAAAADERLPTLALVERVHRAVRLPVVAAGGLMDGADIARALAAGAVAAQLGTAFVATRESGATPAHKRALLEAHARGTALTTGFTGRPARAVRNALLDRVQGAPTLAFPIQGALTRPIFVQAIRDDDPEYQPLWAGEGYARARALGAGELVAALAAELQAARATRS